MKAEKVFWGLFFIVAAVFLLTGKLGIFEGVGVFSLALTVLFAAGLIKGLASKNFPQIFFSIAFLAIIYSDLLHLNSITPWPVLGAALLASIGCSMLFHNGHHDHYINSDGHKQSFNGSTEQYDGERLDFQTTFGTSIKYINSDNFEFANVRCSFGTCKVYFDNALIQKGNATVNLDVSFGGVELYIPKTWRVINNADFTFGGLDEKNRNESTGTPTLTLTGDANFSGVSIMYI